MSFRGLVMFGLVAVAVAAGGMAEAETRLFTARADAAGVTIVEATRDGVSLPVAGQNGAETFFRIDNPAGAVPCTNRIVFTTSTGRTVETTADLCATDWDLTVRVAAEGGNATGSRTAAAVRPASPNAAPSAGQPVIIATDDANVTITDVFLKGEPAEITARRDPYVQIVVPAGPPPFACSRDIGLVLSDSRRIARLVDVCQSDFVVVIPLVGGPPPAPPSADFRPSRVEPAVPAATARAAAPAPASPTSPAEPEIVSTMQWQFTATASGASLVYEMPDTDVRAFTAVCLPAARRATVTLARTSDDLGPGRQVNVRLAAGSVAQTYTATGSAVAADGLSRPVLQIGTDDPIWGALIRERVMTIAIGDEEPYGLSLTGSAAMARPFLAACNPAPAPAPAVVAPSMPPPPVLMPPPGQGQVGGLLRGPGPGGHAIGYRCDDGSTIAVTFTGDTALVSEFNAPPVVLFQTPAPFGARYAAGNSELIGEGEEILWTRRGGFTRACVPE